MRKNTDLIHRLRLDQLNEYATGLVNAMERGQLYPEDLDPELRSRLVRLLIASSPSRCGESPVGEQQ
jgi:hypothetical protein